MNKPGYDRFVEHLSKVADLEYAAALLNWDKEVNLPPQGAAFRARQISTLSGLAHEMATEKAFGDLLGELLENREALDRRQARNVILAHEDYERNSKLDKAFVEEQSKLISSAYQAWIKARDENSFEPYSLPLRDLILNKREEAERRGYQDHPYDALIDLYEPQTRSKELDVLFRDVRRQLVEFVAQLRELPPVDDSFLHLKYPKDEQWELGLELLRKMGYNFKAGRQDLSTHPFTINLSPQDVRVTTRIDENDLGNMTWSCIHEGGHALYEQGLPAEEYGLPLGRYASLGIHESQSRLWENHVGRSRPFWQACYPALQQRFPDNLSGISYEQFYRGINKVAPSLIRTESDELHYHFHVMIRYEIEKALMEGSMEVDQIVDVWNEKYKAYLGIEVPDAKQGVLQDIHWAIGSFGYFPTYSLGSFYAAQFYHQAQIDIPDLEEEIRQGNTTTLLHWLREKIHRHGRYFSAEDLCRKVTGEKLNFGYFMDYARKKYEEIYRL